MLRHLEPATHGGVTVGEVVFVATEAIMVTGGVVEEEVVVGIGVRFLHIAKVSYKLGF